VLSHICGPLYSIAICSRGSACTHVVDADHGLLCTQHEGCPVLYKLYWGHGHRDGTLVLGGLFNVKALLCTHPTYLIDRILSPGHPPATI
jgi:hypothetical protein